MTHFEKLGPKVSNSHIILSKNLRNYEGGGGDEATKPLLNGVSFT